MAGAQERVLRRRVRSAQSIRKTTRAMELIASSRIPRAQARIRDARPYADRLEQLAADLAAAPGPPDNPLLAQPDPSAPVALVVVAGDRGLSGPYNTQVLRLAERSLAELSSAPVQLVVLGRRAQGYLRFRGFSIDHFWTGMSDRPIYEDVRTVMDPLLHQVSEGSLQRIELISTRYLSTAVQRPERRLLLPLGPTVAEHGRPFDYELEPDRDEQLAALIPQLVRSRLFIALLEATASEYVARQRAMKAATDNADDLITQLRRVMNRARQDAITTEIMDIVGGAEALRARAVRQADFPGFSSETDETDTPWARP